MNALSLIERTPGAVEAVVDGEIVLMKVDTGECIGLGQTGSAVWRLLEEPARVTDLVERLSETYAAPPGVLEQDVLEFVTEIERHGLVHLL